MVVEYGGDRAIIGPKLISTKLFDGLRHDAWRVNIKSPVFSWSSHLHLLWSRAGLYRLAEPQYEDCGEVWAIGWLCIDPAESAQVKPLMHMPQLAFSYPASDVGVGCCRSLSSPRLRGLRVGFEALSVDFQPEVSLFISTAK